MVCEVVDEGDAVGFEEDFHSSAYALEGLEGGGDFFLGCAECCGDGDGGECVL